MDQIIMSKGETNLKYSSRLQNAIINRLKNNSNHREQNADDLKNI